MSRLSQLVAAMGCYAAIVPPVSAQTEGAPATPPLEIDVRAEIEAQAEEEKFDTCEEDQDAAVLTGEIIVCRKRTGDENRLYDKEAAERRHAERTAYKGDPEAPDFILDCLEQGMPFGCVSMGGVPPPVYLIDFASLPDTPEGSDAERAAQGLAPRSPVADSNGAIVIASGSGQVPAANENPQ